MITPRELAEKMKREIVQDVRAKRVPSTVGSFSELHDYVDANCYGGTEALLDELDDAAPDTDEGHRAALDALCDLCNPAMEIVDAWIKAGGIECALLNEKKGGRRMDEAMNVKPLAGLPENVAQYIRVGLYFLHDAIAFGWDMPNKRGIWSSNVTPSRPPSFYHEVPGQMVFVWSEVRQQWERYA